jgi:hypothetical protein
MAKTAEAFHDDVPDERIVPNPTLTLSECINLHQALLDYIATYRPKGDAVLEAGAERLRLAARLHGEDHPGQLAAVMAELNMQARLNDYGGEDE